ncbi:tryptophan 7-halogenase [Rheinheimera baltica]|uniref:Tryptophan 7-halogenase n=1 Tax=Rheinheimera baltica TaxID=67576 RepID=A0ABT9I4H8_9GAMM|nr:tryptophan halogenase family protein [Rheinheimera baltica]MDP5138311.1 tryptophan 7-halogenase [Rheinheimera baltica]MDP5148920.1 tryptophan 7-halogenase [Rheinheimera baltica]
MWNKVVIAGGGTAGWMTAALMAKTLCRAGFEVCLIESPTITTVGVGEATIPSFVHFNRLLGIDEKDLLKKVKATFKLGINFINWDKPGSDYIHGFSALGDQGPGLPFYHYWLRWQKRHPDTNIEDYFLASSCARKNKFMHPDPAVSSLFSGLGYAYHIDASLYAEYLKDYATSRNVKHIKADITDIRLNPSTGYIESLRLDDATVIAGDFFIDCTGFKSLLLGGALKVPFISWQKWLKCDRAQVVPTALTNENFVPYTKAVAQIAGWQWRIPLQHRVGNGLVYSSAYMDDNQAQSLLLSQIDSEPLAQPRMLSFTAGMRARFWEKNCVAVGLSSGFLEPLESTSIHMIQSAISRLSMLFPNAETNSVLAKQFNQETSAEMEKIRDFVILHYCLNNRSKEPFWQDCQNMALPDSLKHKLELYRNTAYIHHDHNDVFTEGSWLSVLVGQGVLPRHSMQMINTMPDEQLDHYMKSVRHQIAALSGQMPLHRDYIQRMLMV